MNEEDNLFQPEQIYKQVEWLSNAQSQSTPQSSDARLISNLRQVQAEDREIVEHVWAKLTAQAWANEQVSQGQFKQYRPENMAKGFQPMQNISHTKRSKRPIIRLLELSAAILVIGALVGGMLVLLQKNRQQPGNVGSMGTVTANTIVTPGLTTTPGLTGTPVPSATQAQTGGCNVSHPATMPTHSGSTDAALFYVIGGGGYQSLPSATFLIRYDLVTGKQTTLIQPASDSSIVAVKLSPDKQWLLVRTFTNKPRAMKLQLIRTDGSMLQTVYESCSNGSFSMGNSAWSPNGQEVAFPALTSGISVLDLTTGKLQTFLPGTASVNYEVTSWINNQQLLVKQNNNANTSSNEIYLLDTSKGVNQQASNLTAITTLPASCGNIALSSDGTSLFSSFCTASPANCQGDQVHGPSKVSVLPSTSGTIHTIYSSQSHAITDIYPVGASSLLIYIENTTGDLSQDGLWKINTDGSGMTRLTTTSAQACQYSPYVYPLTQITSDGQHYALLAMNKGVQKLVVGNLAGGVPALLVEEHQLGNSNVLILAGIGVF